MRDFRGQAVNSTPWDEVGDRKRLSTDYPEQYKYRPAISPLTLLNLPSDIRYMIFRLVLCADSIKSHKGSSNRRKNTGRYNTVHGCIDLLNRSYQLLNPGYSSCKFATEAADVFYRQNVFEIDILDVPSFWILKQMPSLKPFDPLSAISRLRLWLNYDGSPTITPHDELTGVLCEERWPASVKLTILLKRV
jgi:hypothetical protein